MKKVTFLKSHPSYGYFAGDEAELSVKAADELLESKHVEEVKAKANSNNSACAALEAAQARFEDLTGEKAGNRKLETLQKAITEAEKTAKK